MAIEYRIYGSETAGGPVDFTAPIATSTTTSASIDPRGPGIWSFVVRAFDPTTGLEDSGVTPARIEIAADGSDVTGRPSSPVGFVAKATSASSAVLRWASADDYPGAPTSFRIWVAAGPIDFSTPPTAIVQARPGRLQYSLKVTAPGSSLWYFAIRGKNARGESDPGTALVATPTVPLPVDSLTA